MADDAKKILRRLRSIELKLDVLIESRGLSDAVDQREAAEAEKRAARAAETSEKFKRR
jgi:hypothetical protein